MVIMGNSLGEGGDDGKEKFAKDLCYEISGHISVYALAIYCGKTHVAENQLWLKDCFENPEKPKEKGCYRVSYIGASYKSLTHEVMDNIRDS